MHGIHCWVCVHDVIVVCVANLVRLVCWCLSLLIHSKGERERERLTTVHDSGDKDKKRKAAHWCKPVIQSRHTVKETEAYFFILRKTLNRHFSHLGLMIPLWHCFSVGKCHVVLLGLGLCPGSFMKEKLTQQVLISAARWFYDFLIFTGLSVHTKATCSNPFCIYDLHLLYDQSVGVFLQITNICYYLLRKITFSTHLCLSLFLVYILRSVLHPPRQVLCLISVLHLLYTPHPKLTHPHIHTRFCFSLFT